LGRITMYTEQSLNEIDKKFSEGNKQWNQS
jgi:hypothetical protein